MTTKYPSIETIFKRDANTNILDFGKIREPEVSQVLMWSLSEKVDGTNIRVIITHEGIEVKGRTDKADLSKSIVDAVLAALPDHTTLVDFFSLTEVSAPTTIYGEAYGNGIQKGGAYSETKRFRAFDIRFGEGQYWHDDVDMRGICGDLLIPVAPLLPTIGWGAIPRTREELTQIIPQSIVALEDSRTEGIQAEGVVAKPHTVLLDKFGNRVMWKLCFREFDKLDGQTAKNSAR